MKNRSFKLKYTLRNNRIGSFLVVSSSMFTIRALRATTNRTEATSCKYHHLPQDEPLTTTTYRDDTVSFYEPKLRIIRDN